MASQKMNSKTHKVITACWVSDDRQHFVVPIDWEIEDIEFDFGLLSYKGEEKPYIPDKFVEGKCKYPVSIEEADWEDVAGYFSCCESDEEEEEDLCEKCEDINCCTKDELICCMCCELLKCDMFSQNCGKCLKPMCMDCDNDERKFNGENVCEKCEEEEEEEK
jgi:hypothetical protein